jgi:hypothetical protein
MIQVAGQMVLEVSGVLQDSGSIGGTVRTERVLGRDGDAYGRQADTSTV